MTRKVSDSKLAVASRKSNWQRALVKGACCNIRMVAAGCTEFSNHDYWEFCQELARLEKKLSNCVKRDYEKKKAELLAEREK